MGKYIAIVNGRIYTGRKIEEGKAVLIKDDTVIDVISEDEIPGSAYHIDASDCAVAPGLIDLQIYGWDDCLFAAHPTAGSLSNISEALVQSGTTGFMLTLATNTLEVFDQAIEVTKAHSHSAFLGLHFEGPYLNPVKRGAHPADLIRRPEHAEITEMLRRAEGVLKMMTVAPELFSSDSLEMLFQHGVLLSAGHSNASYDEAMAGFDQGVRAVTHLFNAMSPLHHRETGLPGAAFSHETACASIIVDGIHVDYKTVSISKKLLGERLFLITDAVAEADTGVYQHVHNGDHFTLRDGTLSGSALSLIQAVANCVKHAAIPLDEALRMASLYPAQLIEADNLGRIEAGAKANIIVFDVDYQLKHVLLGGILQK